MLHMNPLDTLASLDAHHPLEHLTAPRPENCNDSANAARLLHHYGDQLVIALPDNDGSGDRSADIYALTPVGLLSRERAESMVLRIGERLAKECGDIPDSQSRGRCLTHANRLQDAGAIRGIQGVMPALHGKLQEDGLLPAGVVVKHKKDLDRDLTTVGTPSGVLELTTGRLLSPDEGRDLLVTADTGVDYIPGARHPRVDEILPPIDGEMARNSMWWYRAMLVGCAMVRKPTRAFVWEVCAARSGKTTFANTLRQAFGPRYIETMRGVALTSDPRASSTSYNGDVRRLTKPARITFIDEIPRRMDANLLKSLSGGGVVPIRRISIEDQTIDVTSHMWFLGNTEDGGGPELGIASGDENARAIEDRVRMPDRERIQDPDDGVVELHDLEFRQAALARVVEYIRACAHVGFPRALPQNFPLLEKQREREMAEWERVWLPAAIRERNDRDGPSLVCVKRVYDDFGQWWNESGTTDKKPSQTRITGAVKRHYDAETHVQHCAVHKRTEHFLSGHVLVRP